MSKDLDKQIYIYSLDTSAFYNDKEQVIHNKLQRSYLYGSYIKQLIIDNPDDDKLQFRYRYIRKRIKKLKNELNNLLNKNTDIRQLRNSSLKPKNVISIFDSVLTRTLQLKEETLTTDILVVQSYFYKVLEDIITNGFYCGNEKYIYYSSSAGQIRTKKSVFIKEQAWNKHNNSLTCGLSVDEINSKGGSNINKYQSYLALSNSATVEWKRFNINKCIVVPDLETKVTSEVDYIDYQTYEISRQIKNIPIEHTDGCGMILPSKSKKSFMCRLPFIKGLLVPFDFKQFAEDSGNYKVKDIYGKEWDIIEDEIEVIFTKSQFKMCKYYNDWDDYKKRFRKYKCQAAKLNIEDTSNEATLNYQMLQTLTDMTTKELKEIAKQTILDIDELGSNQKTMLRVLGATEHNNRKNHFQSALLLYPNLLNDEHAKQTIKDKKKSLIKDAKSGKLKTKGKYTFICPDLYAFCEKLFLGITDPKGLLKDGQVYCSLYNEGKLNCLRSPHLYREHAIKVNVKTEEIKKWFITEGIYTSVLDPISKMLQFDNDGDKALVVQDKTFIEVAERNMNNIVPLYYEMKKAEAEEINNQNIYKSLVSAYKANIGEISNNITKIWNSPEPDLKVIKWLCMENNFTIDYAKTLYMPTRPDEVDKEISGYIREKVPYFFVYAKDKKEANVSKINKSVINQLDKIIENKRIYFTKVAEKFEYEKLMKDVDVEIDQSIIDRYTKLDRTKKWHKHKENLKSNNKLYIYQLIRKELAEINSDEEYVTDVLVKHLYSKNSSRFKTTLWETYGDILLNNLESNLRGMKPCEDCSTPIVKSKAKKYCDKCAVKRERIRVKRLRNALNENKPE